jgi:hypothetical protein
MSSNPPSPISPSPATPLQSLPFPSPSYLLLVRLIITVRASKGAFLIDTQSRQGFSYHNPIMNPTLQRQNTENSKQLFPERELRGHSPNFHIHVSVSDLYIPTLDLPILLQETMWTDPGNI